MNGIWCLFETLNGSNVLGLVTSVEETVEDCHNYINCGTHSYPVSSEELNRVTGRILHTMRESS